MINVFYEENDDPMNPWHCDVCGCIPETLLKYESIDYCEDCWKARNPIKP